MNAVEVSVCSRVSGRVAVLSPVLFLVVMDPSWRSRVLVCQ